MASSIELMEYAATALSLLVVPLLPLELLALHRRGQLTRRTIREVLASASPVVPTLALAGVALSWALLLFGAVAQITPFHLPTTPWTVAAVIVLGDFTYYWEHRCAHRVRGYWAIAHSVHHSSPDYNQATGLRVSFVDGFISPLFYVPLVALGFEPLLVGAAIVLNAGYQQWIHTEMIGRLPWFDGWLNTPANHRVHHASQPEYLDRNYGGIFMVWDRLFGTYAAETVPPVYGLTTPIGSSHPWAVHTVELRRLVAELLAAPRWADRWSLLIRGPEWKLAPETPTNGR